MNILYRYLLIIIACIALLTGIQVPNLVDQYEKRVDAHLREVKINLQPFQDVADKYFGGSLDKLIDLHRKSEVKAFQDEGAAIEEMIKRKLRFEADLAELQVSLPMKIVHIAFGGDKELLDETMAQYTYAVPLNQDAILTGAAFAAAILLMAELLFALIHYLAGMAVKRFRHSI